MTKLWLLIVLVVLPATILSGGAAAAPPTNDGQANPLLIAGPGGSFGPFVTSEATTEPGERLHAGDEGGASVWFSWTPTIAGIAEVDTVGSNFDTLLDVSAIGTPSTVIASNDDASTTVVTSRICFPIVPGVTYLLAADGYAGDTGDLTLRVGQYGPSSGPCPELPPTIDPGATEVGTALTGHPGTFAGGGAQSFRWVRCIEAICEFITGATSLQYTPTSQDVGWALRLDEIRNEATTGVVATNTSDPTGVVARATTPQANGRIVFDSNVGTGGVVNFELYSAFPDGTGLLRLTNRPGFDSMPAVSPDGTKIAFARTGTSSGFALAVMNADGSNVVDLGVLGFHPVWSPDGSRLAYIENSGDIRGPGIGVVRADGSGDGSLVELGPLSTYTFDWSPDGTKLALTFFDSGVWHIATMRADGRGPLTILDPAATIDRHSPSWSPDGSKIAYAEGPFVGSITSGDIRMMDADGSNDHLVHHGSSSTGLDEYPDWSPDGTQILFQQGFSFRSAIISSAAIDGVAAPFQPGGVFPGDAHWAAAATYRLDVTQSGGGSGTVAGGPITCGATCSATLADGATVALAATPSAGSVFAGWSGACSGSGSCAVSMTGTRAVNAQFDLAPPTGGGGAAPPNLHLTLEAASNPQAVGEVLTYRVTLKNNSVQASQSTTLTVELPAQTTYGGSAVQRGGGCTASGRTVTCPLDFFPSGLTSTVLVSGRVDQLGDLVAKASVVSAPADADPADDSATLTVQVGTTTTTTTSGGGGTSGSKGKTIVGTARADTIVGTSGPDRISGGKGNDRINGGKGGDRISGDAGNDRLTGGPGRDAIFGGTGSDSIFSRDGERDKVDCGPGRDTVIADKKDVVARNCELVHRH